MIDKNSKNPHLIDIDNALLDYITKNIGFPFVDYSNKSINVGVEFKNKDRFFNTFFQDEKKDKSKELYNLPIILLQRNDIRLIKNETPHWASEDVLLSYVMSTQKPTINEQGEYEYIYNRIPIKLEASYSVDILSSHKSHNDHLVEQYLFHDNKYWYSDWYYFRVSFDGFSDGSTPPQMGQERLIRDSAVMLVDGFVLPERMQNLKYTTQIIRGTKGVQISETEMTIEEFRKKYNLK